MKQKQPIKANHLDSKQQNPNSWMEIVDPEQKKIILGYH